MVFNFKSKILLIGKSPKQLRFAYMLWVVLIGWGRITEPAHAQPFSRSNTVAPADYPAIYYEEKGKGDVVILVHGLGLDRRMWDDQFDALARRYRTIRLDLPGFGKSGIPSGPYPQAEAIYHVLQDAGVTSAHVVGLSMGGDMAAQFALSHPEMARSLVLVDASLSGYPYSKEFVQRIMAILETAKHEDTAKANAQWLADPLFAPARGKPLVSRRLKEMVMGYSGTMWKHFFDWTIEQKPLPFQRLEQIKPRTLLVVGELDLPDFRNIAEAAATQIPNARLHVLPSVGHMSNMEDPKAFNKVLFQFLKEGI